jgi:hypothetical protein
MSLSRLWQHQGKRDEARVTVWPLRSCGMHAAGTTAGNISLMRYEGNRGQRPKAEGGRGVRSRA